MLGAKAVQEAGGLVLVQDPREAGHDGMPRAVVSAGVADIVLPVRELAARLAELAQSKEQSWHGSFARHCRIGPCAWLR